jgi:hypothetical protein
MAKPDDQQQSSSQKKILIFARWCKISRVSLCAAATIMVLVVIDTNISNHCNHFQSRSSSFTLLVAVTSLPRMQYPASVPIIGISTAHVF